MYSIYAYFTNSLPIETNVAQLKISKPLKKILIKIICLRKKPLNVVLFRTKSKYMVLQEKMKVGGKKTVLR